MGSILTLNAGSSSLKAALFERGPSAALSRRWSHAAARIGAAGAESDDHAQALEVVLTRAAAAIDIEEVEAVGHRVVHGGPRYDRPERITPIVLDELRRLAAIDPDHLPAEIAIIEAMEKRAPGVPQVACFDTAFHRTMPKTSRLVSIPRGYASSGVERYGFHGLSCAYLMGALAALAGEEAAKQHVILAHLGSGASITAVKDGRSVDTTMGFTPTSGIMMSTRSGDLDPGLVLHLLRHERLSTDELDGLINKRSGLLGVSETSGDMKDLLDRAAVDPRAEEAIALFCHQAKKAIGALAAVLGGVDTLVFSGGIGERAPVIRAMIASGLDHLGIALDPESNERNAPLISRRTSACAVRVIPTDEESVIAEETLRCALLPASSASP